MAEEECVLELGRLRQALDCLLSAADSGEYQPDCTNYCSRFCESVEEHTGRWHVPLPQLQVLRTALCCFSRGATSFPSDCEPVRYTLSSLALSFFELLLFFGKDEFLEDPLRDILDSFQECYSHLERHNNVHLLLLRQVIKGGGPWEHPVLQGILKESVQPKEEVEKYLSSEGPVFFEFRVRYLLACGRIQEAVALAKCCIEHPEVGKHLYFHQAYLTCLLKASHYDHLHKGIALIDGRDAVEIICNSESEERDELLLVLSKAFLTHQLLNGDMYYLWDLIFIWSKLHLRANPSKQDFLQECRQLMSSATNVRSIFPFMKVIRAELGNEGLEFCVELCACALHMDLHHDPLTASLIYKTIAYLLPNDLEVCRACALLVFFQERTVESYKTVYLLYMHPDQEYHVDSGIIKNHMRFEILQILKKGLFFDPEFWNLITLRTNCLKLMSEKVLKAAFNEIMEEDKWIPNYYVKEPCKMHYDTSEYHTRKVIRKPIKDRSKPITRRIVVPPEVTVVSHVKKRGRKPGSRVIKVIVDSQMTSSLRGLDTAQENPTKPYSRTYVTRRVEDKADTRRGRKPNQVCQETVEEEPHSTAKPTECLRDENLPPLLEVMVPELTTVELSEEAVIAQDTTELQAESVVTPPPAAECVPDEILEPREETLPAPTVCVPDNPPASPIRRIVLEVCLPDNEEKGEAVAEDEERVRPHASISEPEPSDASSREQEPPLELENSRVVSEQKADCATEPQVELEHYPLPYGDAADMLEKSAVIIDTAVILEMHNYCKISENDINDDGPALIAQPAVLTCAAQPNSSTERLGSAEDVLPEVTLYTLSEKGMCLRTQQGSEADSPSEAAGVEQGGSEAFVAEAGDVLAEETVQVEKSSEAPADLVSASTTVVHNDAFQVCNDGMNVSNNQADVCGDADDNSVTFVVSDSAVCASDSTEQVPNKIGGCEDKPDVLSDTACDGNDTTEHTPSLEPEQGREETATLPKTDDAGLGTVSVAPMLNSPRKTENVTLTHRCKLCNKEFRGTNVTRHAVAHLQKNNLKCMFCGKLFNRGLIAKRHVVEHIEKLKMSTNSSPAHENGIAGTLSFSRNKHNKNSIAAMQHRVSSRRKDVGERREDLKVSEPVSTARRKKPIVAVQHRVSSRRNKGVKVQESLQKPEVLNSRKVRGPTQNGTLGKKKRGKDGHCCPADGCTRTFGKREQSMTRHAMKCHPFDVKVIRYAFHWKRGKCPFCARRFKFPDHFQDHMKRHDHPLKHACYHHDCKERFKTHAQLRGHMKGHQPLQVQCGFADCPQRFCRLIRLHFHEQEHYMGQEATRSSARKDSDEGRIQTGQDQRVCQVAGKRDSETLDRCTSAEDTAPDKVLTPGTEVKGESILFEGEAGEKPTAKGVVYKRSSVCDKQLVNGHARNECSVVSVQNESEVAKPESNGQQKTVKNKVESETSETHCKSTGQVQKRGKPTDGPSYGGMSNKPFLRLPPTAYLDERYISMPKRRKPADVYFPSCVEQSSPCESQRQRCTSCFSTFPSAEALHNHLSTNKCKSLFGFDSDEESAW